MKAAFNLTPAIFLKKCPELYATEDVDTEEKMVWLRLFTPYSSFTYFIVEYRPEEDLAFGYVRNETGGSEWGYISIAELREMNSKRRLPPVERDLHFTPKKVKDIPEIP